MKKQGTIKILSLSKMKISKLNSIIGGGSPGRRSGIGTNCTSFPGGQPGDQGSNDC